MDFTPEKNFRFTKDQRLRKNADFQKVFDNGKSSSDATLVLYGLPNGLPHTRVGITVGKKFGPAVARNRYKRRLREAFRLSQHELPPGRDYVLLPRPGAIPTTRDYAQSLRQLAAKLEKRLA